MKLSPLCVALIAALACIPAFAQDRKPAAKPNTGGSKSKPSSAAGPRLKAQLAKWDKLNARRQQIGRKLKELQVVFDISSRGEKLKIRDRYESLIKEWNEDVKPAMEKLSLAKLEADPDSDLAARLAEGLRDYAQTAAVTDRIIQAGHATGPVYRLAGYAHFGLNRFRQAAEELEKAQDKNAVSFQDFDLLDNARDYVKYWDKEQKLRAQEAKAPPAKKLPRVKIETKKGDVVVELFENEAPNTVANFISLVEKKFYDGQHVHRVVPHFVVQAGDPDTRGKFDPKREYGLGGPGYKIQCECYGEDARMHFRGSLSMAHAGRDTGGSQFFITLRPTPHLNPHSNNPSVHTVFGRVVRGMDVVDRIERGDEIIKAVVLNKRDHEYKPKTSNDKQEPAAKTGDKKPGTAGTKSPASKAGKKKPAGKQPAPKKSSPGKEAQPAKKPAGADRSK